MKIKRRKKNRLRSQYSLAPQRHSSFFAVVAWLLESNVWRYKFIIVPGAYIFLFLVLNFVFHLQVITIGSIAVGLGLMLETYVISRSLDRLINNLGFTLLLWPVTLPSLLLRGKLTLDWALFDLVLSYCICLIPDYSRHLRKELKIEDTLIHSMAILYWLVAFSDVIKISGIWLLVALCPPLFCFAQLFWRAGLGRGTRLTLSIWSALVMAIFAYQYVEKYLPNSDATALPGVGQWHMFSSFFDYLLLGAAAPYLLYNLLLVISADKLEEDHVDRYCEKPINQRRGFGVVLVSMAIFGTNYLLGVVEPGICICFVFVAVPLLSGLASTKSRIQQMTKG